MPPTSEIFAGGAFLGVTLIGLPIYLHYERGMNYDVSCLFFFVRYANTEFDADPNISNKEHVSMIYLRRFLDQLAEKVSEKEYKVQKTR